MSHCAKLACQFEQRHSQQSDHRATASLDSHPFASYIEFPTGTTPAAIEKSPVRAKAINEAGMLNRNRLIRRRSQPVWPRTRQRNWSPNHHGALHRPWGRLECGWSEEGCRLVVRWRLTNSSRLLDGTCEQFFCRFLFSAAADFQKREYAEHQDHCGHNAEQSPTARSQPGHRKEVSHWWSTQPEKARFAFGAQREGKSYSAALNKFLGISLG